MHQAIKFTSTGAVKVLPVLDVLLEIDEKGMTTCRFPKPTDKRTLLTSTSDHPQHVKSAISKGVALRLRRICSNDHDFVRNLIEEAWVLRGRGHEKQWIVKGFADAMLRSRHELLEEKPKMTTTG